MRRRGSPGLRRGRSAGLNTLFDAAEDVESRAQAAAFGGAGSSGAGPSSSVYDDSDAERNEDSDEDVDDTRDAAEDARSPGDWRSRPRGPKGMPPPSPSPQHARRQSKSPQRLDPAEQQQRRQERRQERKRKADVDQAIQDHVPQAAGVYDARSLARNIANNTGCLCGGRLTPIAPAFMCGAHSHTLLYECSACDKTTRIDTNKRQRLTICEPTGEADDENDDGFDDGFDDDDGDDADDGTRRRKRKQKPRTQTNGRPCETVAIVIGCLFTGVNYHGYKARCDAEGMRPSRHGD